MSNNSAGRLFDALEKLKAQNRSASIKDALLAVFQYENRVENAYYAYTDLLTLVQNVKRDMEALHDNELYLSTIHQIESSIILDGLSVNTPLNQLIAKFEPHLTALKFCVDILRRYAKNEVVISSDDLMQLLDQITAFESDVLKTSISSELQSLIIEHVTEIRESIIKYQIMGPSGLKRAMEASLGAMVVNRDLVTTEQDNDKVKRWFDILGRINLLYTMGKETVPLFEPVLHHILGMAGR